MALLAASGLCSAVGLLTGAGVALKWGNDSARRACKLRGLLQPKNLSGACRCAGRFALVVPRLAGQCTLVLSNFHSCGCGPTSTSLPYGDSEPPLHPPAELRAEFYTAPFDAAIRGRTRSAQPLIGEVTKREAVILHVRAATSRAAAALLPLFPTLHTRNPLTSAALRTPWHTVGHQGPSE